MSSASRYSAEEPGTPHPKLACRASRAGGQCLLWSEASARNENRLAPAKLSQSMFTGKTAARPRLRLPSEQYTQKRDPPSSARL